ncbi:MAG TPA: S41 family peptidase [Candidatus Hypogeohydataceae bacterium YC38]|nr:S41 family peptidase [Candidatus Brocadiales bacterium]
MSFILRHLILILTLLLVFHRPCLPEEKEEDYYRNYEELVKIVKLIQEKYIEEVGLSELLTGAYRGMLEGLDPYSQFIDPEELEELRVETEGKFGGLGIEVVVRDGILTVITPIIDSPAFRAGVMVGDKIVKIEGKTTDNMSLREAIQRLRGKPGTPANITVIHHGETEPIDITIVRDIISVKSIRGTRILDGEKGIGYVALTNFQDNTAQEMDNTINNLLAKGMKSLILDLRFNPGGLLNVAIDVADRFLEEGVIVSTQGRDEAQNSIHYAKRPETYPAFPLVVLVNNGSASASEIVAGAIKDLKRGLLVGTKTFGKGSVQSLVTVEEGHCALKLTTAKYYTPSGKSIHEIGVEPDVIVQLNPAETRQLHEYLAKINNINTFIEDDRQEDIYEQGEFIDLQLQKAVEILRGPQLYSKLLNSISNVNPGY